MRTNTSLFLLPLFACTAFAACDTGPEGTVADTEDNLTGPGRAATDARTPELGDDLRVLRSARVSMAEGIAQAQRENGPVIEAKYELGDDGKLSLSIYPLGAAIDVDPERNTFRELAGDPTVRPFAGSLETFGDQEHLTRSARDLTLVQLSRVSLAAAVDAASTRGLVFWAIPTMRYGRAGYGVYTLESRSRQRYFFVDGQGPTLPPWIEVEELGDGPGAGATDARVPELGGDPSIVLASKISMADALAKAEEEHGPLIEAKFELGDDGKLSLSIYPIGKELDVDAERNTFFELAGDPTADTFAPEKTEFTAPDAEHLTRSARELTIVQIAGFSLADAVSVAEAVSGGFVYWAIPTIRDARPGYGVYTLDEDGKSHYLFVR